MATPFPPARSLRSAPAPVIDPRAPRRPDGPRRDWLRFRGRMLLGPVLVGAAVLASAFTEPVVSLVGRDLSETNVGVGVGVTVFNLVMFLIAHAVPPLLVAVGLALPLVGVYQYREVMLSPKRRRQPTPGAMPVGRATALCWAEVAVLLAVAVVGIIALNPREKTGRGLAEPTIYYVEPPWFQPN